MKLHDIGADNSIALTIEYLNYRFPGNAPFVQDTQGLIRYGYQATWSIPPHEMAYYGAKARAWHEAGRRPDRVQGY